MASILNATTTSGLVTSADNSGSLQLQTNNGTTAVTIDTSQNVGIGTTSPATKVDINGGGVVRVSTNDTNSTTKESKYVIRHYTNSEEDPMIVYAFSDSTDNQIIYGGGSSAQNSATVHRFFTSANNTTTSGTERMRITSSGLLLIGTTSGTPNPGFSFDPNGTLSIGNNAAASGFEFQTYRRSGVQIGSVYQNGTTAVLYNTTSDYRLKENIAPMTGALATVAQLKPCTYTWKVDGSAGQGFIAHELQAVVPDCVAGEKDAVETYIDEEGNEQTRIKPQGIDTSFLVATLTAAIQELKAELDTVKAELNTLKNPPVEGTE